MALEICDLTAPQMEHLCEMKNEMLDMLCEIHDEMKDHPTCRHIEIAKNLLKSIHYIEEIKDMNSQVVHKSPEGEVTGTSKKRLIIA